MVGKRSANSMGDSKHNPVVAKVGTFGEAGSVRSSPSGRSIASGTPSPETRPAPSCTSARVIFRSHLTSKPNQTSGTSKRNQQTGWGSVRSKPKAGCHPPKATFRDLGTREPPCPPRQARAGPERDPHCTNFRPRVSIDPQNPSLPPFPHAPPLHLPPLPIATPPHIPPRPKTIKSGGPPSLRPPRLLRNCGLVSPCMKSPPSVADRWSVHRPRARKPRSRATAFKR